MILEMVFGMIANPHLVSMYLRFGRRISIAILVKELDARIKMPSLETIQDVKDAIRQRHPLLENVWRCMDGLKLYLQMAGPKSNQNNFYNGWKYDHYVGAVICCCPDGTILVACFNVPDTVHDSEIASSGHINQKFGKYTMTAGAGWWSTVLFRDKQIHTC